MRSESIVLVARRENVRVLAVWEGLLTCSSCVLGSSESLGESVPLFDVLAGLMLFLMGPWYDYFLLCMTMENEEF